MRISNLFILLLKGTLSHKQRLPYHNNTNLIPRSRLVSHSLMSSACSLIVWYDLYYRVFQGSNEVTITIRVSHTLNSCFHFPLSPKSTPQSYDISPISSFKNRFWKSLRLRQRIMSEYTSGTEDSDNTGQFSEPRV